MRFGVCTGIEKAVTLADAGYDYIELSVAADLIPDESDAVWAEKRQAIKAMPLKPEAFNSFVRTGKIVGPDADPVRLKAYVETALQRVAEVDGRIVVFGSGGARNIPEGFNHETAMQQIDDFLGYCADSSERTGVVVVIEPLNRSESNILNLVSEGAALARRIARPGVQNLADTYHMEYEKEPLAAIVESADVLAHTHTADSGRFAPGTGTYDHVALFRSLREAGFDARLSVECSFPPQYGDFSVQITQALQHLKKAMQQAG